MIRKETSYSQQKTQNRSGDSTPQNDAPVTFVHEVPSGLISKEVNGTTYVFYNGNLILTIINENNVDPTKIQRISNVTEENGISSTLGYTGGIKAALTNYLGWIEYTESAPVQYDQIRSDMGSTYEYSNKLRCQGIHWHLERY